MSCRVSAALPRPFANSILQFAEYDICQNDTAGEAGEDVGRATGRVQIDRDARIKGNEGSVLREAR